MKKKIEKEVEKIKVMFVVEGKEKRMEGFGGVVNGMEGVEWEVVNEERFCLRLGGVVRLKEGERGKEGMWKVSGE